MNTYFTADMHVYHDNIIKYCNRPFQDFNHMNEELIRKWNERVKNEDLVFHIGDFGFGKKAFELRKRLNGDIIFIQGNHDRHNAIKTKINNIVIKIGRDYINLVHNPQYADSKYKINLVGHVHNNWECKKIRTSFGFTDCINVGVDVNNFQPVTYNELMKKYYKWRKNNGTAR